MSGRLTPYGRIAARAQFDPCPGWMLGSGQSATIPARLRKTIWRLLRVPFEIEWLDGLRLTLYPDNELCRSLFVTGLFEPNEFHWLARFLQPGMTFIDVGANIGLYTLFSARRVREAGRVLAIEPSAREMDLLRSNVELNSLSNVSLSSLALSDHSAEVELLVAAPRHAGHNTLGAFGYDTPLDHRERVSTVCLDHLVESDRLSRVDVIKMDIEGAELSALRGAAKTLRQYHPALLLELSDRALQHQSATSGQVLSFLTEHDYSFFAFDARSGLPVPLPSRNYFDSENIIALTGGSLP